MWFEEFGFPVLVRDKKFRFFLGVEGGAAGVEVS